MTAQSPGRAHGGARPPRRAAHGLVSELLLVRMHGRAADYLDGDGPTRARLIGACRAEATVPDLAERILGRTIYSQAATRVAPLRELLQNALDASPRGARVDVVSSDDGAELTVVDRGRGMTQTEVLLDLLVPFASGKQAELDAIGEHGIGFFSVLEIAPRVCISTSTATEGHRLDLWPLGPGPRFEDFGWSLTPAPPGPPTGTVVRCSLARPIPRAALVAEVTAAAGLVDPAVAAIYVDGALVNTVRARLRRVARAPVHVAGEWLGDLELYLGSGEGIERELTVVQGGLFVSGRADALAGPALPLHRDMLRAIAAAGYGLVAELPLAVPLNKGRSAVAGHAARAVETALVAAFERFVLEDALHDRELLRAVDHRLSSVLDRLVAGALSGETSAAAETAIEKSLLATGGGRTPTVAAPEDVVRFAAALADAPLFEVAGLDAAGREVRQRATLRWLVQLVRAGLLREPGTRPVAGCVHLVGGDPLSEALWRRLRASSQPAPAPAAAPPPVEVRPALARTTRAELVAAASHVPGVPALAAAITILERIDGAISLAAGVPVSPVSVHQDLFGPDEMAHTDGSGISVNLASARVRELLGAVLTSDDAAAFGALVDLMLHEKTHVSLASFVPRANAEHGASFYRRKDHIRRRLLEALACGAVADPIRWLAVARRGVGAPALPAPAALAEAFVPKGAES